MKNRFFSSTICIAAITLILFSIVSCECDEAIQHDSRMKFREKTIDSLSLSPIMVSLIDSFIIELKTYRDDNKINLVGYIRILDSHENSTFKVCLTGLTADTLFKKLSIDNYFYKDGIYFCVDYNLSNLMNNSSKENRKGIIKESNIARYKAADTKIPAWLVLIKEDSIIRINKNAEWIFGPRSTKVGVFTESGTKYYDLTEWGEVIDESGKIIEIKNGHKEKW